MSALTLLASFLLLSPAALAAAPRATFTSRATALDNSNHLYTLDGWGGVHPVGASPALAVSAYWQKWDIARGLALFDDGTGGYVLDGWGGIHAVGSAPAIPLGAFWSNWDIARGIALLPGSDATNPAGYEMDGWGGLHAFGSAPTMAPQIITPK